MHWDLDGQAQWGVGALFDLSPLVFAFGATVAIDDAVARTIAKERPARLGQAK